MLLPLFHFWFCLFGSYLFFYNLNLVKSLSILFIFSKNEFLDSLIFCIILLDCISLISALIFIISFLPLWALFVVLFQVPLSIKFDFSFELFLAFCFFCVFDRPVMLWISLLGWLSQCARDFGLLCLHFNLFQGILISSLISLLAHSWFNNMVFSFHVFVYFQCSSCGWFLVSQHCGQRRCLIWFQSP